MSKAESVPIKLWLHGLLQATMDVWLLLHFQRRAELPVPSEHANSFSSTGVCFGYEMGGRVATL